MTPYVITLTGPSRCGKSRIIQIIKQLAESGNYPGFNPTVIQKYTTREFRSNEIEEINNQHRESIDIKPVVGLTNSIEGLNEKQLIEKRLDEFKKLKCDLAYEQYGIRYGIKMIDIFNNIKRGKTSIIILNDIRTVEDLKILLGEQCYTLFVFREIPNIEIYQKEGRLRNEDDKATQERFEKAESIYRIYIENIYIFDNLILNVNQGNETLEKIIKQIMNYLCSNPQYFK
jgi:guanylate kinase